MTRHDQILMTLKKLHLDEKVWDPYRITEGALGEKTSNEIYEKKVN